MKPVTLVIVFFTCITSLQAMDISSQVAKTKQKRLDDMFYHAVSDGNEEDVKHLLRVGAYPDATCPKSAKGNPYRFQDQLL